MEDRHKIVMAPNGNGAVFAAVDEDPQVKKIISEVDYVQVIDNSMQFHGFDSSFMLMADFLRLGARNFCHAYVKSSDIPDRFYRTDVSIIRSRLAAGGPGA